MHVEHNFDVSQKLEKFKQRVGERRKAALTIKTASGIASFEESKQYDSWFSKLLSLIRSMLSASPGRSIEPIANADTPKMILMMN